MRALYLIVLALTGCSLGPRYEKPAMAEPMHWKAATAEAESTASVENWWDLFQDDDLASLERQVIERNKNLYVAIQKVSEARAMAGIAKSDLYPQAYLNPIYNNVDELIELYGVPPGLFPGLKTITRVHEQIYQLPVAMAYEVDLWGKFRGTYNAAKIYAQAQDEALRATLLSLSSQLASHYFNVRTADTHIQLIHKGLELKRAALDLVKAKDQAGIAKASDVLNAQKELCNWEAEYQEALRCRTQFENAIAVLVAVPASEFSLPLKTLEATPPAVPPGLVSAMLLRRPDIAQAERNMASFHAFIGVAYATYFPSLCLTSALGFSSPDLSQFLNWSSRLWQIGANVAQVIFNGWRNRSYVELAFAKFERTKGEYENTVLLAFQEVEDALTDIEQQEKSYRSLDASAASASAIRALTQSRYEQGISNRLDLIQSEIEEINAQRIRLNVLGQRYQSSVQLIKALGGGWDLLPPPSPH